MSMPRSIPFRSRMIRRFAQSAAPVALAMMAFLGLSACEEDVVAVTGTDVPYSIYGVLSPQLDSQWVRVFPVEERLVPATPEPLDAQVVSIDRTTGERYDWRDSVIVDFADQYAHVYYAPFQARFGHTYEIAAIRSDGEESTVEVTVPAEAEIIPQDPIIRFVSVVQPVWVRGDVPGLVQVEVEYAVAYKVANETDIESDRIVIPYLLRHEKTDGGWIVPVDLRSDYLEVTASLAQQVDVGIDLRVGVILLSVTLRFIAANEAWDPPGGIFNEEVLIQPNVMRNVRNGFGFVGAGYRLHKQWLPPVEAIEEAGFRSPEEN